MSNEVAERIVKGSFVLTLGQLLSIAVGFVFSVLIANLLGRDNYGLLSIALTYPSMVASLVDLGLGGVVSRYTAKPGSNKDIYAWTGLVLRALTSAIGGIIVYLSADYFAYLLGRPILTEPIRALSFYTIFSSILGVLSAIFNGLGKYEISASINITQYVVRGPLAVLFVLLGLGIHGAALAYSIGYMVVSILYMALFISIFRSPRFSLSIATKMLGISWPLFVASLSGVFLKPIVDTILSRNVSNSELGDYGVALNSLMPLGILLGSISTAVLTSLPILIENVDQMKESAKDAVFYSSTISIALGFCYLSVIYPLTRIYGRSYVNAPIYAIIYGLSSLLPVLLGSLVIGNYFIVLKATKYNAITSLAGFSITVILSYMLTPIMGVAGAGLSYIVGNVVSATIAYAIASKSLDLKLNFSRNIKTFIPSLIAFISGFASSTLITIHVSTMATVYFILGLIAATITGLSIYSLVYLALIPFFTDRETIYNLFNLATRLEYVGGVVRVIGSYYLKYVSARY
ncbi:MAG: oligosaccharide flippase family protein [Desulfurococcaceae archaeon]